MKSHMYYVRSNFKVQTSNMKHKPLFIVCWIMHGDLDSDHGLIVCGRRKNLALLRRDGGIPINETWMTKSSYDVIKSDKIR